MNSTTAVPVTVLTGFLGSGKTTLLAKLLRDPRLTRTAVIINEFGEVGLDHELLEQSQEELVLLSNGCICCTVRGDLVSTLLRIDEQRRDVSIERVVIETTGLADPGPILHSLMIDSSVTAHFFFEHLVTTVDAFNGMRTLNDHDVARRQVAMADRLVLTKLDLVDESRASELRQRLRALNPFALECVAEHGAIDPGWLFPPRNAAGRGRDPWLDEHRLAQIAQHQVHDHGAHDQSHDKHHHDEAHLDDIDSFSLVRDEPISLSNLESWLRMISAMRGPDLLRVKGLINVSDHPDRPVVIHGVQHIFHPAQVLDRWPGLDKRTRLVFITRNIEREDIEATLEIFER